MRLNEEVKRWLVPPILVPLFLGLLLAAVMVGRW
jgi:hypothetical protein